MRSSDTPLLVTSSRVDSVCGGPYDLEMKQIVVNNCCIYYSFVLFQPLFSRGVSDVGFSIFADTDFAF